jgi:hypothetical protein
MDVVEQRMQAIARWKGRRGERVGWLALFAACFWCLYPQTICRRADTSQGTSSQQDQCERADLVLPLCVGIWRSGHGRRWLQEHFQRDFVDIETYVDWIGEATRFGGTKAF